MVYLGGAVLAGIMKVRILYPLPPPTHPTHSYIHFNLPYSHKSRLAIESSLAIDVEAFDMIVEIQAQEI